MVKFTNKAKGRPSKRRTLKTKFKIQRRVKQHRKKMKKEANKLASRGIKPKSHPQRNSLPNLYPYKYQLLQQHKHSLPEQQQSLMKTLDTIQYGLVTLENKCSYLPKPKDILLKKHVTNLPKLLDKCKIVLELLEARCPFVCVSQDFRTQCREKGVKRLIVLTKTDTIEEKRMQQIETALLKKGEIVFRFSNNHKLKNHLLQVLLKSIKDQYSHMNTAILVAGKGYTGKHTFLLHLIRQIGKYQNSGTDIFQFNLAPNLSLMDASYKIQDTTFFPLFEMPNQFREDSLQSQEEKVLRKLFFGEGQQSPVLKREDALIHFCIQEYISVDDLLKKIGKALRIFGKGGMIDVAKVRNKILAEWFTGKLNDLIAYQS